MPIAPAARLLEGRLRPGDAVEDCEPIDADERAVTMVDAVALWVVLLGLSGTAGNERMNAHPPFFFIQPSAGFAILLGRGGGEPWLRRQPI